MKVTKKVLSLVLALTMLLTMASFPAFAANIVVSAEFEVGETYNLPIEVLAGEKVTKVYDATGLITFGTPKAVDGRTNLWTVEAKMNTKGITKIVVEYTDVNEDAQEVVSSYVEIVDSADEPTAVDVTFVDVDGANDDVVKKIVAGATVTIPDAYATGYKFYADEDCTEEIDLATETFDADSTIYVKAQTTTPDPDPEQPTGSKTVEFVKTASYSKIDQHKSNMSFALPQVDIYVGDTIKFPDTFFADNEFTYGDTAVSGVSVAIRNCATQNKAMIYSWGKDSDPTYKASYTFTEAGFYMLTSDCFYKIDGTNPNKYLAWTGDYRWGVIEVKPVSEYGRVVTKPTTDQTSGDPTELASATLDYLPFNGKDATVQSASILGTDKYSVGQNTAGSAAPAGTVLGLTFELEEESFVEQITFTAANDNMFSAADIYGSLDGADWYLIADDQQISPNGTSSAWELTTFTATVDAVAKYVKIKNFTYKGATYLTDISGATVEGYVLQGSLAPTTCEVTFIDKTSLNPKDDVIVTVDIGSTVTVPTEFATGYKFYADEDCTEEIDLATETFDADTTIYVKAQTTTPDPEEPAVVIPGMDRIEITDEVLDTLPITQKVGDKNYVITGWKMNGEDIDYAQLKNLDVADVTGDIVPTVVEVPFDVDLLTAEAKRAGQDGTGAFDNGSKYENGLYLQGAQIRFPDTQAGITAGLRFVTVLDKNLENKLLELNKQGIISGLDHGMVCIAGVDYTNKDLNINTAKSANWGDNIYQSSGLFDGEYYKYTLCVTGFKVAHYEINVCVRPVIKFNYNGETIYLYGEQYNTNYKAVVQEAYNQHLAGNVVLTDLELEYCQEILGLSTDNDTDIGDIIG